MSRPRLMERMRAATKCKLVLLSAPAGYGKTTLLSEWIRHGRPRPLAAWLSLEQTENDPLQFWDYVIAALRTIEGTVGTVPLALLHSGQVPIESTVAALISDLAAVRKDFFLVLDDYQFIQSRQIHEGLTYLLDHLPPPMHVVIATRVDPPLPVARLRGRGMLLEFRSDGLRFSPEETASLLTALGIPVLPADDVRTLNARTEGWVVGLKMAALSMTREEDVGRFIAEFTGSHRHVMDYLVEEVLRNQPEHARRFLLETSVLERMCGVLCDAITESGNGQIMLLSLEQSNLFVVSLDASREWYRYHHLFRDLLRHQLGIDVGVERVKCLHLKASQWYRKNGFAEDAIHHALAAEDWSTAMELISDPAVSMPRWRSSTLLTWLARIPEDLLRRNTQLYLGYASALQANGQPDAAESCLNYLDGRAQQDRRLQGSIGSIRAMIATQKGDADVAERHIKEVLALLPRDSHGDRGTMAFMLAGIQINRGQIAEAEPLLRDAAEGWRQAGAIPHAIMPLSMLGVIDILRGRLHAAFDKFQQSIELAKNTSASDVDHVHLAHLYISNVYYEWNELDKAAFHQQRAIEMYRPPIGPRSPTADNAHIKLARTRAAQGNDDEAARLAGRADRLFAEAGLGPSDRDPSATLAAYHVAVASLVGDTEAASEWLAKLAGLEGAKMDIPAHVFHLLQCGKGKAAASAVCSAVYGQNAQQGFWSAAIAARICQALVAARSDEALGLFAEALRLARPEGYVRTFVDFGAVLAPLLRQAISRQTEREYAARLLEIIEDEQRRRRKRKALGKRAPERPRLLTARELEVMRLVAGGLSNEQIADRLMVTLATAKTHVHHVFQKLEAADRLQAVNRARDLKLI